MRVEFPRRLFRPVTLLLVAAFCVVLIHGGRASAQTPAFTGPQTRLIFFADRPMAEGQWTALFAALRKDLTGNIDGALMAKEAVLVRGNAAERQNPTPDGIAVYLHGSCTLLPPPLFEPPIVKSRLGWVPLVNGRIQPFVHVDCGLLVKMLGAEGMRLSHEQKEALMGDAIAHVVAHEWIHYATQNAGHSSDGISKPGFTTADLLNENGELQPRKAARHQSKAATLKGHGAGNSRSHS